MSALYQFKMIMSYDENHISHHKNDTEKVKSETEILYLNKIGHFFPMASLLSDQRYKN